MKTILELTHDEAKAHFFKNSSYFNSDLPRYINFEKILKNVDSVLKGRSYKGFIGDHKPKDLDGVNYRLLTNKDGKFAWRPLELIHPVLYVELVNLICMPENWKILKGRFDSFSNGPVQCVSIPVVTEEGDEKDRGEQVLSWWQEVEQDSLKLSLKFSHLLHTDVTDCYGSIYTHSIPWAIAGKAVAKNFLNTNGTEPIELTLGNQIDAIIRHGRFGQTNGIPQGSVLMDFIAEIVLGYVDLLIKDELEAVEKTDPDDYHILRYRDDYRIFTNSDRLAEKILKIVSASVMEVGMKLGASKTLIARNVVEGSIKPDKLAAIELQDLGTEHAKSIQKQLLRIHAFGQRYPNSGALKRLLSEFHTIAFEKDELHDDLAVQIAILTDIAFTSPSTIPAIAALLSKYLSFATEEDKKVLWEQINKKTSLIPNNGYLEIWLQRIVIPETVNLPFDGEENLCTLVKGKKAVLWDITWVSKSLRTAMRPSEIIEEDPRKIDTIITREEIELFKRRNFSL